MKWEDIFTESGERDSQMKWRGGFTESREGDSQKVGREIPRKWGRRFPESGERDSQKVVREIHRKRRVGFSTSFRILTIPTDHKELVGSKVYKLGKILKHPNLSFDLI